MFNKSDVLMESKSLRESVIDRIEVLEKVKKLELLPDDIHLTVEMVSNFFEVNNDIIRQTAVRRKEELESDGMRTLRGKELSDLKSLCGLSRNIGRLMLFTKRSVLRIGMVLEESPVARTIRDQLLDSNEHSVTAVTEVRVSEFASLSPQLQFMIQMEQRHNALEARLLQSENQNNELKQSVTHLSLVVDNEIFINDHQKADIQNAVFSRIGKLTSMGYETHFQSLFRALKLHFNVPKYDKIKRVDFDRAIEFVSGWFPKLKEGTN